MDPTALEAFVAIFAFVAAVLTWRAKATATLDDPAMVPVDDDPPDPFDL